MNIMNILLSLLLLSLGCCSDRMLLEQHLLIKIDNSNETARLSKEIDRLNKLIEKQEKVIANESSFDYIIDNDTWDKIIGDAIKMSE